MRGKFESEGQYHVYQGDVTDWSDMFDWIGTQPWSTGRIGTYGCSYLGEGQIIAANSATRGTSPRSSGRRREHRSSGSAS